MKRFLMYATLAGASLLASLAAPATPAATAGASCPRCEPPPCSAPPQLVGFAPDPNNPERQCPVFYDPCTGQTEIACPTDE